MKVFIVSRQPSKGEQQLNIGHILICLRHNNETLEFYCMPIKLGSGVLDMKLTGWLVTAFAFGAMWFGGGTVLSRLNILKVPVDETPFMLVGWLVIIILCIATHIIFVLISESRSKKRNGTVNLANATQATDS